MYNIHYRFRSQSEKNLTKLAIDEPYIACKELAFRIAKTGQFGQYKYATKDTLELSNSATGIVYKSMDIVPAGTSVVVRKIPCGYGAVALQPSGVLTAMNQQKTLTSSSMTTKAKDNKLVHSIVSIDTKRHAYELEETLQPSKKKVKMDATTHKAL